MNRLSRERQIQVIAALVEGNSIRSTVRMTGVAKNTVLRLLRDLGAACWQYHDTHVRDLSSQRVQVDEIWSFCYAKAKNVPPDKQGQAGDVWTWAAIDSDSRLAISWLVGSRDAFAGLAFMEDVAARLTQRVQLTTDGHRAYLEVVDLAFAGEIDHAVLVKLYGEPPPEGAARPYTVLSGEPDPKHVSTSYVERQNLTMRMGIRRFTRLTNAFSKKIENHGHAISLHYVYYNFVRIHQTLRVTPAMEAGVTDRLWDFDDLVDLLEEYRPKPGPRGPYKKRNSN